MHVSSMPVTIASWTSKQTDAYIRLTVNVDKGLSIFRRLDFAQFFRQVHVLKISVLAI